MLTPYRNDLPPELWNALADLITGGNLPDRNYAIHLAHDGAGYALGQAFPDGPNIKGDAPIACTDHVLVECCRDQARGIKQGAFPWLALAIKLAQLLVELLAKKES